MQKHITYLGLGSNLGDRHAAMKEAVAQIEKRIGAIVRQSALYETEPWGFSSSNLFLNACVCAETVLSPEQLLLETQAIEHDMGRASKSENGQYADRIIDIDILLYDELTLHTDSLHIPHPHINKRRFVLQPLNEILDMTARQRQQLGLMYDAKYDESLLADLHSCEEQCYEINALSPSHREERMARMRELFGRSGEDFNVITPFFCDYGYNIEVGEHFFANTRLTILDEAKVTFGSNVFIGPNCSFFTACHPLTIEERNKGWEWAEPIHVGDNVWFGGNVTVVPGVTIGNNVTIGAGSVVTKDIPDNTVAAGNPCRVIRQID